MINALNEIYLLNGSGHVHLSDMLSATAEYLDPMISQTTGTIVWIGLLILTIAFFVMSWTKLGQGRPLVKCLVLSIFAHLLMVIFFYLWRRKVNVWFVAIPMVIMLIMPAWALTWQLFNPDIGWARPLLQMLSGDLAWQWHNSHLLLLIGLATLCLQVWMVVEGLLLWPRARGVLEEALPPLEGQPAAG